MAMEAEVLPLLKTGFVIIMSLIFLVIITLLVKYKKAGYGWLLMHSILFSWACWGLIDLLGVRGTDGTMASEENSLKIGMIGIIWAASMICMAIGLVKLRPSQRKTE